MNYLGTLSPAASSVDSSDLKSNSPMSSSMSPPSYMDFSTNLVNLDNVTAEPYLDITEQPVEKFRFRYKSEMVGTHGSLSGINSDKVRKSTYPTVALLNYDKPAIIRCTLVQIRLDEPHAHRLIIKAGAGEEDDPHDMQVSAERGYQAVFQGMGIIHTAKKNLVSELEKKKIRIIREDYMRKGIFREFTSLEEAEIRNDAEQQARAINLNTVRLKFEAFREENDILIPICQPKFSIGINNLKSALTGELKIVRMDHTTTSCVGGQEIFILVEKVTKNNIKVRFFEHDEDGNEIWSDFGKFSHMDVHHQYAIVFKAPPYKDQNIENTVEVCIELFRPSDGAKSEPRKFRYKPSERAGHKRRRYSSSTCPSSELPTTINNISFGDSVSISNSLMEKLQPEFLKDIENVHSDDFHQIFERVSEEYSSLAEFLVTDGPSIDSCSTKVRQNLEIESLAKTVVSDLALLLKQNPTAELMEKRVLQLFTESLTKNGDHALHTAILCEQFQHLQYILVLLSKMKHKTITNLQNNSNETALHIAVRMNNNVVVTLLLSVGADPNITDCEGNTPLHLAILDDRDLSIYSALVKQTKLDIENDEGKTVLCIAVQKNNMRNLKLLVDANANINYNFRSNGNTVLHTAVEEKCADIISYLLDKTNARLDSENFNKITPVQMANSLAETEGDEAKKIANIFTSYIKAHGFEAHFIKIEPPDEVEDEQEEDEESDTSLEVKVEEMEVEDFVVEEDLDFQFLKKKQFSLQCIRKLTKVLDKTETLRRLTNDIDFTSIGIDDAEITTKQVLSYANVTGVTVYAVRQHLRKYRNTESQAAITVIDDHYLSLPPYIAKYM